MQKHEDNLAARINGNALQPLAGASVTVTDDATGLPAALYSDDGVTPLAQPIITGNEGEYAFYAANGEYTLTFSGVRFATFTRKVILADPSDNPYLTQAAAAAPTGAAQVGFGSRTVADKLEEVPSVKDYGAAGDGVSDDAAAEDAAHAYAGGKAVAYPAGTYANTDTLYNTYGNSIHKSTLWGRFQAGLPDTPTSDSAPIIWVQKNSSANRDTIPTNWDQVGYYGLIKKSGNAYGAAFTAYGLYQGGAGDLIGVHGRVKTQTGASRAYASWFYVDVDTATPTASHAVEFNGRNQQADPGHGSMAQLVRICMADSADTVNRFGTAISIGKTTHGGDNGFWTGINIEADAIIATAGVTDDGEAIQLHGATTIKTIGGIRLAAGNYKYALRTDEGTFANNNVILMATSQAIRWGDPSTGVRLIGGSNNFAFDNGFINILDPVSDTALQVASVKVVGARKTGWSSASGTATRSTFATSTVTTPQLAERVKALMDDLISHGLIGA